MDVEFWMVKRIYLIGFMGTGKSTVGKRLAEQLGFTFLDTDLIIEERAGMPIPKIFETSGEMYFRNLETAVLIDLERDSEQAVIATGGGIVLREANRLLLSDGQPDRLVVHLTANVSTLVRRLEQDSTRPLLRGDDLQTKIIHLQRERKGLYDFADVAIATDLLSTEEIVEQILPILVSR